MIGDVGREIGVGAVGLLQRTIDIVAECGRAEQRLLAVLPVLDRRALRRRQAAFIDVAARAQPIDRCGDAIDASRPTSERSEKKTSCVTLSAARSSRIAAIIISIALARTTGSHSASGCLVSASPNFGSERRANRLQIVAGIKALGDRADIFAQRLAVAQIGRAREHIDLRAGIVDVVFARDREAGEGEQVRQRVAEHGAAAMADMHRPGRIGRDIFDVDRAHRRRCRSCRNADPRSTALRNAVDPGGRLKREIDEAWAGDLDLADQIVGAKLFRNRFREFARLLAGILGQHHGGIGRHVAMRRIARRLDRRRATDRCRPATRRRQSSASFARRTRSSISAKMLWTTMRKSTLRRHVGAPRA